MGMQKFDTNRRVEGSARMSDLVKSYAAGDSRYRYARRDDCASCQRVDLEFIQADVTDDKDEDGASTWGRNLVR